MATRAPGRAWRWVTGALLAAALVATGCAASDDADTAEEPAAGVTETGAAPAPRDADDAAADGGFGAGGGSNDAGESDAGGADETRGDAVEALQVGAPLGRKVVFTAHLSLQADDTVAAVEEIRRAVERVDGFVAAADLHRDDDDQLSGTLTLRVPSGQLDTTLDAVRRAADRVVDEGIDSDDVTEEYADVEAQLRNLRALEVELLSLLAEVREKSDSAEQVLSVFERIRQVRGEIEKLEGRRQVLEDLVSLATVQVSIQPTPSAAPLASEEWRPGEVVRSALRATVGALRVVVDVVIWLTLTVLPLALVVVGLPLAVTLALRRWWRRRPPRWAEPVAGGGDGTSG